LYCLVSEKPLRLFIPLIFSGGIWNFLLSTPRAFPAGTIGDTFYEFIRLMLTKQITFRMKPYTTLLTILMILFSSIAFAERLAVSSDTANIRSGPGTDHDILWKVEKYHPLFILKKTDVWYHFRDFEEDEGWIHESLVNRTPTVITNSDKCNVRSGPGTGNKILFAVDKGIPFKVLDRKGKWLRIQHADGDKGWIHESLVW